MHDTNAKKRAPCRGNDFPWYMKRNASGTSTPSLRGFLAGAVGGALLDVAIALEQEPHTSIFLTPEFDFAFPTIADYKRESDTFLIRMKSKNPWASSLRVRSALL